MNIIRSNNIHTYISIKLNYTDIKTIISFSYVFFESMYTRLSCAVYNYIAIYSGDHFNFQFSKFVQQILEPEIKSHKLKVNISNTDSSYLMLFHYNRWHFLSSYFMYISCPLLDSIFIFHFFVIYISTFQKIVLLFSYDYVCNESAPNC